MQLVQQSIVAKKWRGNNHLAVCNSSFAGRTSWHRKNEIGLFETSDCFAVSAWPQQHSQDGRPIAYDPAKKQRKNSYICMLCSWDPHEIFMDDSVATDKQSHSVREIFLCCFCMKCEMNLLQDRSYISVLLNAKSRVLMNLKGICIRHRHQDVREELNFISPPKKYI